MKYDISEKWLKLDLIVLGKVIQVQKDKWHMFSIMCRSYLLIFIFVGRGENR